MATRAKAASAADLDALDLAHLFHPNTNLAALHKNGPLVLARGKGIHVWDTQGKQYIEAWPGSGARRSATATRSSRPSPTSS